MKVLVKYEDVNKGLMLKGAVFDNLVINTDKTMSLLNNMESFNDIYND